MFDGLWYTNEGYFVLVQNGRAWEVGNNGAVKQSVSEKVTINGDTKLWGKLMVRRRGEEHYVSNTSIVWPIIKDIQ